MKTIISIILALCLTSFGAAADDLQVIISGKAIHMGSNDLNEDNYGLGLQYDFNPHQDWVPVINMASFKDSNDKTSRYVGGGLKRRFKFRANSQRLNFDVGAIALAMVRPDYNDEEPFYGVIPFISFSNNWGGINATYVPEIESDTLPFWYFQFSIKLMTF